MPGDRSISPRHLDYSGRAKPQPFTAKGAVVRVDFKLVQRQRATHAAKLRGDLQSVQIESEKIWLSQDLSPYQEDLGINLEIRGVPGYPLSVEPFLGDPNSGVVLNSIRHEETTLADGTHEATTIANVFVKHGKLTFLTKRIEDYAAERKILITKGKRAGKEQKADHEKLFTNIESIGIAAVEAFWTSRRPLPDMDIVTWWEVWVRAASEFERARHEDAIILETDRLAMERRPDRLILREHTVFLIKTSRHKLASATAILNFVSELRHPALTAQFFMEEAPAAQHQWADDLLSRIRLPPVDAPAVCLLDTGVNRGHSLLSDLLAENDQDTIRAEWGKDDHHPTGHGTPMAGLAAYGDLTPLLESPDPVILSHFVESVKILPRAGVNEPQHYGSITQAAMSLAEYNSPFRKRIFALAVTASDADDFTESGKPSAWSAALDSHTSGAMEDDEKKYLICVSGGNTSLANSADFPAMNYVTSFGDPAQSWNAITVGAFTDKDIVTDENGHLMPDARCISSRGGLSPHSATTCLWTSKESRQWPLKPDVVFEGGNVAKDAAGNLNEHDSLSLLTTHAKFQARPFTTFWATSASTALAARMAAQIQGSYPNFWPETLRALMIHSAEWTDEMKRGARLSNKGDILNIVQRFGHGVPNLERALASARSRATLICQDDLQPFEKTKKGIKTRDMMLYRMPWPKNLLQENGNINVRLRVTLSYFIEPNPGSRMVSSKYRYAGCNLRFATQTPTDKSVKNFIARVSDAISQEDKNAYEAPGDASDGWQLGDNLRRRGSVHSDTWSGTAAQLAAMEHLIVFPVNGWWRLRNQHGRYNKRIRYTLVVTLETVGSHLDIFTPISLSVAESVSV